MAAEHEISQLLPLNEIEDVHRMGLRVYALRKKVRALADARKGGREHLMSLLLQRLANPLPAPAAMPSPMNQNKRSHSESSPEIGKCSDPMVSSRTVRPRSSRDHEGLGKEAACKWQASLLDAD